MPLTQSQLLTEIADRADLSKADAKRDGVQSQPVAAYADMREAYESNLSTRFNRLATTLQASFEKQVPRQAAKAVPPDALEWRLAKQLTRLLNRHLPRRARVEVLPLASGHVVPGRSRAMSP